MAKSTKWLLAIGAAVLLSVLLTISSYNSLVSLDQGVQGQWAQVENVYQRRADLIPNLVSTVKGAANFEKDTLTAVTEARAQVGKITPDALKNATSDPEAFKNFEKAQGQLTSALSRLLVVSEQYPQLRATENFRDLQAQLEGTENRITVERMRFNDAAREFNSKRNSFPTVMLAGFFGDRFHEKPYFQAEPGSHAAPKVSF
jgi:LemA protein